jgi:hypothetical protein
MSPEQLAGEDVDHRSDIFSFGTMLYEAATGQHPFEGKSPGSTIGNIQKEEPRATARWIEGAIPEVERIARKCLRKDRAERYQSFRDLLVDLNAIRRGLDSGETQRTTEEFDFRLPIGPAITRGVFLFIQGGYLALYGAVFYWGLNNDGASIAQIIVEDFNIWDERVLEAILVLAMVGIAIRLYLISAVGWNHPEAGKNFVRLFPGLVVFDGVWAAAPLLMIKKWQLLTLGFVACMAYVAFAQRTLILSAYPGARYRTTTLARPSSRHD